MSKYDKHRELIKKVGDAYNDLPIEERMKIRTFTGSEKLLTIWQALSICKDDMTPRCRRKLIEWADNIEKTTREDFRLYQMTYGPKVSIEEEIQKIDKEAEND